MVARKHAALLVIALLGVAFDPGLLRGDEGARVEVEADRLRIDHRRHSARFEGNVRARYQGLVLTCKSMEVSYDEEGAVVALRASGQVVVKRGAARATAARARLDARQGLLVLEGGPVLVQGGHRLEGARIAVHLADGRLEVEQARGSFRVDLGGRQ
jgi:lipopolysaccharide export system protein LptA